MALFVRHAWRAPRPLLDVKLFRVPAFGAAAAATFLLGAALFGALILLPLYYQVARGEDALTAGLLMAPQGIGAALVMPIAGRLTDRMGGGVIALFGLIVMTIGTVPFAYVTGDTSYGLLAAMLFVRGLGLGATMMPAMAAAYATLENAAVPRATSALNAVQRMGGSVGTALLAVTLQGEITERVPGAGGSSGAIRSAGETIPSVAVAALADAFASTFWWAVGLSVVALIPTTVLALTQRRERRAQPPVPV